MLNRLTYLLNKFEQEMKPSFTGSKVPVMELFRCCYNEEIEQLLSIIKKWESDGRVESKVALISSFSNNGKTLFYEVIKKEMEVFYVDMCQFDDISLNVADLLNYIESIFQLTNDKLLFFDNLDAVCYEVESGDQQRRQERIAAKLILRKLLSHMKIYNKFIVFTCKNETAIDP